MQEIVTIFLILLIPLIIYMAIWIGIAFLIRSKDETDYDYFGIFDDDETEASIMGVDTYHIDEVKAVKQKRVVNRNLISFTALNGHIIEVDKTTLKTIKNDGITTVFTFGDKSYRLDSKEAERVTKAVFSKIK